MEKLHEYQGWQGRFHEWRDGLREKFSSWREENPGTMIELVKKKAADAVRSDTDPQDYSHIYRFLYNLVFVSSYYTGGGAACVQIQHIYLYKEYYIIDKTVLAL